MSSFADIVVRREGPHVVARLVGEVDVTNVGVVGEQLVAAVPNDAHALVLDLGETAYLDSAAIELLFELSRRLRRRRQDLRLVVPAGSPLTRVLELTGVHSVAHVAETLATALAGE